MRKLLAPKVRREHAADRPRIDRSIGMSPDVAIYGTDIQARTAADAVQDLTLFAVGE